MNSRTPEGEGKKIEGGKEGLALRARISALRGTKQKDKAVDFLYFAHCQKIP